MKYLYLFMVFFALALTGHATNNTGQSLNNQNKSGQKDIIIHLKSQFDAPGYARKNLTGYSTAAKRSKIISSLKQFCAESQESIVTTLKNYEQNQEVSNIKQLWIANIITCSATDQIIENLKSRKDIEDISFDTKQSLIEGETAATVLDDDQQADSTAYNITMVRALEANKYGYTGKGVVVSLLDTGLYAEHQDLIGSLWTTDEYPNHGWNFINDTSDTSDGHGHGTHCAGTILGNGKGGIRTGVAPDAKLMILRVADENGSGTQASVWEAIQFAIDKKANVLSMSLGFSQVYDSVKKEWRKIMDNLLEANIIAVVAAGNEGAMTGQIRIPDNIRYPGACPAAWLHPEQTEPAGVSSVVTIGATTKTGTSKLGMSSIGPVTWQGILPYDDYHYKPGDGLIKPDIVAPGDQIVSLGKSGPTSYVAMSGTSMATPCVAGMVAAMLSKNPELTPADIVRILSESAIKLSQKFNNQTGAGRADALLATLYTPNIDMNCTNLTFDKTVGEKNNEFNQKDEGALKLSFKNELNEDITDYQVEVECLSTQATIQMNNDIKLPAIKAGETTDLSNVCTLKINEAAKLNSLIDIAVIVRKGDKIWTNLFRPAVVETGSAINDAKADAFQVTCFKYGKDCVLQIALPNQQSAVISLYNSNGQLIRQMQENINETTTLSIPAENRKGIHFITVNAGGETVAKKVVF